MRARQPRSLAQRLAILLGAVAILLLGYFLGNQYARYRVVQEISAQLLERPRELPLFTLVDHNEQPFGANSFQDHWSFVYFGCIDCADSRESILQLFSRLYNRLVDRPALQERMRLVFIALDQEVDPPEQLKERVFYYNPEFLGVTGESTQLETLQHALADRAATGGPDALNESALYLIGPDAELVAVFTGLVDINSLNTDLRIIVDHLGL